MSLAMTDHYFPKDELEKMGTQVANGEKLHIDPEVKWRFIQMLKAEGVGKETSASRAYVPVEALQFLEDNRESHSRKWWRFWKRQ